MLTCRAEWIGMISLRMRQMQERGPRRRPMQRGDKRTTEPLAFRPSPDMRTALEASAARAGHTLSAEIELRLRQAFEIEAENRATPIRCEQCAEVMGYRYGTSPAPPIK